MRSSYRYLGFFFVLLLLLNPVIAFANGIVNLRVQIQSGYLIEVPETLVFPALAPGQTVEQSLIVKVKSNVAWDLTVSAEQWVYDPSGEAQAVDLSSNIEVLDFLSFWRPLFGSERYVVTNKNPTSIDGEEVEVRFRMTGEFGDQPGEYGLDVVFTVVPVI
ncbi:MAG: hypothetical protein GX020_00620 [Firmicutes bacterium]|nr:hypothetical protein [Bacillota bacterium]